MVIVFVSDLLCSFHKVTLLEKH